MNLRQLPRRHQRTLRRSVEVRGIGFLTGATVRARFLPAPADTGIVFKRVDLGSHAAVPARIENVSGTNRRTTISTGFAEVALVEHVLATLAGLRVDNCVVELNAPEPPGLDGSTGGFVDAIHRAGVVLQQGWRPCFTVNRPVVVRQGGATLALHPATSERLLVSYLLDYGPTSPIARQTHTEEITPGNFAQNLSGCRTFILEEESEMLLRQGIGSRTTTADLLVFGRHGPIDNYLRFANEPARHKVLDLVGDLALLGVDLAGHLVAYRSGHPMNIELARAIHRELIESGFKTELQTEKKLPASQAA
jgi:UDP-3-O-acyl N-acetylglucosamine deacetylase